MKKVVAKMPWIYRTLALLILVLGGAMLFFLWPSENNSQNPPPERHPFYSNLSHWSRETELAVDELEPDLYSYEVPNIAKSEVAFSIEAEDVKKPPKGVRFSTKRENFQGRGFVYRLKDHTEAAFSFPVTVPTTQHYDITICMAADKNVENALRVGESLLTRFTLSGTGKFTRVTFYGIFLEAGETLVSIDTIDAGIDIDYLELTNDTSIYDINFAIDPNPCNPNATEATKKLYAALASQWGEQIITGQFASDSSNREISLIYEMTGQLPVIRFSELGTENDLLQIEAATDWHLYTKGVVGLMWHWNAPGTDSVYAKDSGFNLTKALYAVDTEAIAGKSPEELDQMLENKEIPENCRLILRDIDNIAASLKKFANMDIPILWRPLHEASGGWYWWGASNEKSYIALWNLLYNRLTHYHQLNNLIWIWNGQSTSYLVPEDTYDIASVDVYLSEHMTYGSRYEQFLTLSKITNGKKMLALSECSSLPSMEMMMLDHTIWSYFGLWYGEYIMDSNGKFTDTYYSSKDLYNLYNSDRALSLNDFLAICQ